VPALDDRAGRLHIGRQRFYRRQLGITLVVGTVAATFLVVPTLAVVPARVVEGCATWIATGAGLELLSALGFVVFFKLVFAARLSWRRTTPAALCALGASTVLPAGGLVGPTVGSWSISTEKPSLSQLARATITFVALTNAPGAAVLAIFGTLLWLGLASGPHQAALTIVPALVAVGLLGSTWFVGRTSRAHPRAHNRRGFWLVLAKPTATASASIIDARALVTAGDWKLVGALGYYAFDNAVLWAAFHAYGPAPPVGVVVMGYLVGSLASALPIPAGLGVLEGGLIGALVLYGAPAAPAAAAVLLYRGISLSVPIALGALGYTCRPEGRTLRLVRRGAQRRAVPELAAVQLDGS
jgi:uncharacterized membrane protein YbhN (UPF0104 family)